MRGRKPEITGVRGIHRRAGVALERCRDGRAYVIDARADPRRSALPDLVVAGRTKCRLPGPFARHSEDHAVGVVADPCSACRLFEYRRRHCQHIGDADPDQDKDQDINDRYGKADEVAMRLRSHGGALPRNGRCGGEARVVIARARQSLARPRQHARNAPMVRRRTPWTSELRVLAKSMRGNAARSRERGQLETERFERMAAEYDERAI
jgi:hypothetical protein